MKNRTKISFFALLSRYEQILNDMVIIANSDLHSRSKWGEAYDHLVMDHIEWKYYIRKEEVLNFSKLFSWSYIDNIWQNKEKQKSCGYFVDFVGNLLQTTLLLFFSWKKKRFWLYHQNPIISEHHGTIYPSRSIEIP